jgi:hypothetical protein
MRCVRHGDDHRSDGAFVPLPVTITSSDGRITGAAAKTLRRTPNHGGMRFLIPWVTVVGVLASLSLHAEILRIISPPMGGHSRSMTATQLSIDTAEDSTENPLGQLETTGSFQYDILLVVPGFGNLERLPMLQSSVEALFRSTMNHDHVRLSCLIYVWEASLVSLVQQVMNDCTVQYSTGLWTHHLIQIQPLHTERPTHVIVMMDDIDARTIHLPTLLDTMTRAAFTVASPSIPNWQTASSRSRAHCLAHQTQHVDILFTVFTASIFFDCWQRQIDPAINEYGWGHDITLADTCPGASIGIVDHQAAIHRPACPWPPSDSGNLQRVLHGGVAAQATAVTRWNVTYTDCVGDTPRTYDTAAAMAQMMRWIRTSMQLPSIDPTRYPTVAWYN